MHEIKGGKKKSQYHTDIGKYKPFRRPGRMVV